MQDHHRQLFFQVLGLDRQYHLPDWHDRHLRDYERMTTAITVNRARNSQIADLICQQTESTLVLSNRIDHCHRLFDLATKKGATNIAVLVGTDSKKTREKTLNKMREGKLQTIIATSLADQGLDIRRLTIGILALPERSSVRIRQRTGRLMRPFGSKQAKPAKIKAATVSDTARNRSIGVSIIRYTDFRFRTTMDSFC